ncbi:farnesyl-diphosphate synthase [Gymnopus androsaceus JB14]|uniref:(2E,6E)-farnesyl diphosphate synthase n=1 Tax=Gymnopus androsaceus JB14 TaxID=1447944 RepID=A0A6A4H6F2_9AGAR|nr:farnesyl-diphosphate synthase [Gymnopus androsaceus JB14]
MATTVSDEQARFEGAWSIIRNELLSHFKSCGMPAEAQEWYTKNLDYNVTGGKLNHGMAVVDTIEILKGRALTDEEYFQAAVLGWSVELLQAFFVVADDIIDSSITRRGQPCWYRVPKVNLIAVNDAPMLESAIYRLLKVHFKKEPYYVDLVELFHETTYQTLMGQLIDVITAPEDQVDLSKFSSEKHSLIVIYKTAYYSFYLPVALAMLFCCIPTSYVLPNPQSANPTPVAPYDLAKEILIPLGEYFQIQDDFLDFSGTPAQIGKNGTDIVDNKCSWCINTALSIATPEQRKILDENYGVKPTPEEKQKMVTGEGMNEEQGYLGEAEKRVTALFEEMGLRGIYEEYEKNVYKKLSEKIDQIDEGLPDQEGVLKREVFSSFMRKIYQRQS